MLIHRFIAAPCNCFYHGARVVPILGWLRASALAVRRSVWGGLHDVALAGSDVVSLLNVG
jgi:hypothetical protein